MRLIILMRIWKELHEYYLSSNKPAFQTEKKKQSYIHQPKHPATPRILLCSRYLRTRSKLVRQMALAAVLAVVVERHEHTSTALGVRALASQPLDLAVRVYLIVLEDSHFNLFVLVLDLLRGVVRLLFPLLSTATKTKHQVKSRLLLNIVIAQGATILELLAGEDEALLVGRNALLVLDFGLDIINGVA